MTQRECLQPAPCTIDDFRSIAEDAKLRCDDGLVRDIILDDQDPHFLTPLALSILGRVISGYPESSGMWAGGGRRSSLLEPLPFILASGTVGEDVAVEAMKAGAHDYVLKTNLTRLPLAIERELRDAETRREAKRARCAAGWSRAAPPRIGRRCLIQYQPVQAEL
jgi:hypothetical protein